MLSWQRHAVRRVRSATLARREMSGVAHCMRILRIEHEEFDRREIIVLEQPSLPSQVLAEGHDNVGGQGDGGRDDNK